jgi:hypothetical protein
MINTPAPARSSKAFRLVLLMALPGLLDRDNEFASPDVCVTWGLILDSADVIQIEAVSQDFRVPMLLNAWLIPQKLAR